MTARAQPLDAIVVGAGVSGLTVAHGLRQRGRSCAIVDAGTRAGGVIGSRCRDGFLYELGPNSTLDTTPRIAALLQDLGIAHERVDAHALASTRYIVREGRLVALPTSPVALLGTRAFSRAAKLRLLGEPFVRRAGPQSEETVAAFVRRRLGAEFLDYAVEPFVAGIYAGDPERLSVAAAFPRLLALERQYGSLVAGRILGARARSRDPSVAKNVAQSFSFRGGMRTLVDALASELGPIAEGTSVRRVAHDADVGLLVEARQGDKPIAYRARSVALAVPAHAAAAMVEDVAPDAAQALSAIEYAPIAVVAGAYHRRDVAHSLAGFGFLVPRREGRSILGCLFSSSMFDGRAPQGEVLLTAFCGGRRHPEVVAASDEDVAAAVSLDLSALLCAGAPLWQEIVRWPRAIPQYDLGHLDRLRRIARAEAEVPGLYFCGSYRGGVAVGDRIESGHAVAERVDALIAGRRHATV